jgi:hypothetical protein
MYIFASSLTAASSSLNYKEVEAEGQQQLGEALGRFFGLRLSSILMHVLVSK